MKVFQILIEKNKSKLIHKLLLIFCFLLITVSLILIRNNVTSGYEISVYRPLSFISLLGLFFPAIYSIFNIFIYTFINNKKSNYFLIANLILFLIVSLTILLLPTIRGYAFYPMGDAVTHVGIVFDSISSNHISDIIYPITHILIASLYFISGIDYAEIITISAPFYSILSILYLYILAHLIFESSYKGILTIVVGFFPLSTIIPSPHNFAALLIPLALFIYFRNIDQNYIGNKILLIIFAILYPFFHPLVSILLILSLFVIVIISKFIQHFIIFKRATIISVLSFSQIPLITLIIFFLWLWGNYWYWNFHIGDMIRWFFSETVEYPGRYSEVVSIFHEYSIDPISLILKNFGQNLIYIFLSFLAFFWAVKKLIFNSCNNYYKTDERIIFLSSWIIVNSLTAFMVMFLPSAGGPDRMLYYTGIISPIFVTYIISNIKKRIIKYIMAISLVILIINSAMVIHQSDYSNLPNMQVTRMEIAGSDWLLNYKDSNINIKSNHERFFRIADLIKGEKYTIENNLNLFLNPNSESKPLDHFGYDIYSSAGNANIADNYLILEKYDEVIYFQLYSNSNKFNKVDFEKLDSDKTVEKIYYNGEFRIMQVEGIKDKHNST